MFWIETRPVVFGRPQPSRGLVGQRHRGLVVALAFGQIQRPLLGAVQRLAALAREVRAQQR